MLNILHHSNWRLLISQSNAWIMLPLNAALLIAAKCASRFFFMNEYYYVWGFGLAFPPRMSPANEKITKNTKIKPTSAWIDKKSNLKANHVFVQLQKLKILNKYFSNWKMRGSQILDCLTKHHRIFVKLQFFIRLSAQGLVVSTRMYITVSSMDIFDLKSLSHFSSLMVLFSEQIENQLNKIVSRDQVSIWNFKRSKIKNIILYRLEFSSILNHPTTHQTFVFSLWLKLQSTEKSVCLFLHLLKISGDIIWRYINTLIIIMILSKLRLVFCQGGSLFSQLRKWKSQDSLVLITTEQNVGMGKEHKRFISFLNITLTSSGENFPTLKIIWAA